MDLPLTTMNSISRGTVDLPALPVVNFFPPSISSRVASVIKIGFISSVSVSAAAGDSNRGRINSLIH